MYGIDRLIGKWNILRSNRMRNKRKYLLMFLLLKQIYSGVLGGSRRETVRVSPNSGRKNKWVFNINRVLIDLIA